MYAATILATLSLALAAPVAEIEKRFTASGSGDLTYYNPSVGATSCGGHFSESDAIVALSTADVGHVANPNDNPVCGKTITIHYQGKTATARVEDTCEGCAKGSIDTTPAVFEKFGALSIGRLHGVTWSIN